MSRPWPRTLADVVAWLRARERPVPPTPPGAPPFDPDHAARWPAGTVECAVCGAYVPRHVYTSHLTQHADGERPT
jgi:hypothetical protein